MAPLTNRILEGFPEYVPGEQPRDRRYIKLNTNENPFPPSPRVLEAMRSVDPDALRRYPDPAALELRRAIGRRYGFPPERIFVSNGSDELIRLAVFAFSNAGEPVIFPAPSYPLYETLTALSYCVPRPSPLDAEFRLAEEFVEGDPDCMKIVANPNSPTGTVFPAETIGRLVRTCRRVVLIDEAYVDFAPGSSIDLARNAENVIVARTFSKSFSLAGLRVGYCFAGPDLVRALMAVKDSYNLDAVAQAAATAAIGDYDHMLAGARAVAALRERCARELAEIGFRVFPSGGNFLFVRPGRAPAETVYRQLRERGILVRFFDAPGLREYLRITIGTDGEMAALLDALRTVA